MSNLRIESLRDLQRAHGLQVIALVPGANLFYCTGLQKSLSERPCVMFLPVEDIPHLLLPEFEVADAEQQLTFEHRIYTYSDAQGYSQAFRHLCRDLGLNGKQAGIEFTHMRVFEQREIALAAPECQFVDAEALLAHLRIRKDPTELAALQEAARLNERVLRQVIASIELGQSEKEIAAAYQMAAFQAQSDGLAFDPIVVSGPNGALPHAYPGDRHIRAGEFITLDCGVKYRHYCSDITRTIGVGEISDRLKAIYDVVYEANEAGRSSVRPGVTAESVDRATRQVITKAGYGDYFTHRTGHGLGLEVHEPPYIVEGNATVLEPGMVFTIEPGIYIPGLGGVRIEDNVFVTPTGCESLTTLPRELILL